MNLERVNKRQESALTKDRSQELDLPVGTILVNQLEYIVEILMSFDTSLQLRSRTTPGNQETSSPAPAHRRGHLRQRSLPRCSP